jgi:hypothetical protein
MVLRTPEPKIERELPMRRAPRTDNEDPTATKFKTETAEPNLPNERTLIVLPKSTCAITDV